MIRGILIFLLVLLMADTAAQRQLVARGTRIPEMYRYNVRAILAVERKRANREHLRWRESRRRGYLVVVALWHPKEKIVEFDYYNPYLEASLLGSQTFRGKYLVDEWWKSKKIDPLLVDLVNSKQPPW